MQPLTYMRYVVPVWLALIMAGCAGVPPQAKSTTVTTDQPNLYALVNAYHVRDARYQAVKDRPYLMVALRQRYLMREYGDTEGIENKRAFILDFIRQAHAVGDRAMGLFVPRIPTEPLRAYASALGLDIAGKNLTENVLQAYRRESGKHYAAEVARVTALADTLSLDRYWSHLIAATEQSIMRKGRIRRRLLTAPAVPFISGWIAYHNWHDDRGPQTPDFAHKHVLRPGPVGRKPDYIPPVDWALLERFAPVVVQETALRPAYPKESDQFGAVSLAGTELADATPMVDSTKPAIYAFVDSKIIQGHATRQLYYTIWYPRHPKLKSFDPEAGPIDGWTIRITLDDKNMPQVVESVSNCGCYYKIFPTRRLEERSAATYPQLLQEKRFHLEQHLAHKFDAVVPEVIGGLDNAPQTVVLYFSAGHHQLVTVRARSETSDPDFAGAGVYELHAYDELEHLPFDGREASVFGEDGLVRAAHRPECTLLTPSGLYHAGHPRQRETQMIYFDEADFDDPHLLEEYLRLPPSAFRHNT